MRSVESYSTNVVTYTGNNREPGGVTLSQRYRLSVKEIEGTVHTRLDYQAEEFPDGVARSMLLNGKETFVFQTATNELEYRIPVIEQETEDLGIDIGMRLGIVGRIPDFSDLRTRLHRVALDMTENPQSSVLTAVIPQKGYNHFALRFNTQNETFIGADILETDEEGTVIETKLNYIYQEHEGVLLKVGEITEVSYNYQRTLDTSDYHLPVFETDEVFETVSDQDFETLKENGTIFEIPLTLGDPSDLDNVQTTVTLYNDLSLNSVDTSLLRARW